MSRRNGFAIACAWPETWCKEPGSWYDKLMNDIGISQDGYYPVGHAALILVDKQTGNCNYYDFGRYETPNGYGRVRNASHDQHLTIKTKAIIDQNQIINIKEILEEVRYNNTAYCNGPLYGTYTSVKQERVLAKINKMIGVQHIEYGPFIPKGTNCARFVNGVIRAGRPGLDQFTLLKFPLTLSPTPMWNLRALQNDIIQVGEAETAQESSRVIAS